MRFKILLYPGFDELDAIAPFEVLSMAARRGAPWTVELVVLGASREVGDGRERGNCGEVRGSNGLCVRVDAHELEPRNTQNSEQTESDRAVAPTAATVTRVPEVLIVPGGGWVDRSREGARSEYDRGDGPGTVAGTARDAHTAGSIVASVCTGAMLLARAGLLRGRRCITHRSAIEDLEQHGAVIVRERVVDDGDIVTAGGVTSGVDLALHLVERFASAALSDAITETLEYPRTRAVTR